MTPATERLIDAMRALAAEPDLTPALPAAAPDALSWFRAPPSLHRSAILNALRIDPADRTAVFAVAPFRIVMDEGVAWIAGAVGCPPCLHPENWHPSYIRHVILWNPKRDELRVLGEAQSQAILIMPDDRQHLIVYADGYSFFRAWAERRAEHLTRAIHVHGREWTRAVIEPSDSCIPGALALGDLSKLPWAATDAETIIPGPGVDPEALKTAVWRAHRVPRVIAPAPLRRAA